VLLRAAQQLAKWTLPSPLCRENIGVMNMFSRSAMVEARCAQLEGYVAESPVTGYALEGALTSEEEEEEDLVMEGVAAGEEAMEVDEAGCDLPNQQQQQQQQQQEEEEVVAVAAAPTTTTRSSRYLQVEAQVGLPPPPRWEDTDQQQQQQLEGQQQQEEQVDEDVAMQLLAPELTATPYGTTATAVAAGGGGQLMAPMAVPLVSVQLSPTIEPPEAPRDWILIEPLRQEAAPVAAAGGAGRVGGGGAAAAAAVAGRSGVAHAAGRRQLQGQLAPAGL
jgi:hypothetical protein